MSETDMVEAMNQALAALGVSDSVDVAGQFQPRGTSGAFLSGGLIGGAAGGALGGGVGDVLGELSGSLAGEETAAHAQGLPEYLLVGVSATMVYGMPGRSRHTPPRSVVFAVARAEVRAVEHQRGMVRVLELVHEGSGSTIELEGSRVPLTHSKDVIDLLVGH